MSDTNGQPKDQIENAYNIENTEQARGLYKNWAETYNAEVAKHGYATPGRCARAVASFAPDLTVPVLDVGCGTGLSGMALKDVGFSTIDGCDISPEMLAKAGEVNDLYRKSWQTDLENPFPFEPGTYAIITAMGVITPSHAPPETIDAILSVLPKDGLLAFSLNDHALEDPTFEARIAENVDTGTARLLFKEHGDHLPGFGLGSVVYVLQKA